MIDPLQNSAESESRRGHLPHQAPVSVSQYVADSSFFVTFCVDRQHYAGQFENLGQTGPLVGNVAVRILCAFAHYRALKAFFPSLVVVMPDHVHVIAKFSDAVPMSTVVKNIKRFIARQCGIVWQRDYFDHRLRCPAEEKEKYDYVAANPRRKGLCDSLANWPYHLTW